MIPPVADPTSATFTATIITIISKLLSFCHVTHSHVSSLLLIGVWHHLFGKIIYFLPTSGKKKLLKTKQLFSQKNGNPMFEESFI